ncbi:MAG: hypothetical protein Q8Q33_05025 [Chlamydiota bacterium]|nr:hypothetical protein [Chlamydiota bacterium]
MTSEEQLKRLAYGCLICALLSWLSLPVGVMPLPLILSILSIICGFLALRFIRAHAYSNQKIKRVAQAGLFLGLSNVLLLLAASIWIVNCFRRNPIAH